MDKEVRYGLSRAIQDGRHIRMEGCIYAYAAMPRIQQAVQAGRI